jgi:hypothetical protein
MLAGPEASGEDPSKAQILLGLLESTGTGLNRSGAWPASSASPWVWSTPTSVAASRKVWSKSRTLPPGASLIA